MHSVYLPQEYNFSESIALIAGKGAYPLLIAEKIASFKCPLKLIAFEGETEERVLKRFKESDIVRLKVGQLGGMLKALAKMKVRYALMAGQITPKRLFKGMYPDVKMLLLLARLKEKNAESIFGAICDQIEKIGVKVLDARSFIDENIVGEGFLVGRKKPKREALLHGIRIAKEVARLNIGQSVVVSKGTVLAVEAYEGTDKMLSRVGQFEARDGLFVKAAKFDQDYRFDVPVFGWNTLEAIAKAGIRYVALEAGSTILLQKEEVCEAAAREGVSIFGFVSSLN